MDKQRGNPHPVQELVQEVREIFLKEGFDEIENPVFIPEDDVYKQYGSEAPVVLDRCFYLAGLPRPDIGLGKEKKEKIREINENIQFNLLQNIFREYREGTIEGDDLVESLIQELRISPEEAFEIIQLFPAFQEVRAEPSSLTLRSHMTAAWYLTLEAIKGKHPLPVKFFSVGMRFRREQKVDATHLRAHYGASCVIMDRELDLEKGMEISRKILRKLGFEELNFVKKPATSNYYKQDTEYEIYSGDLEIADCGMYSKESLENYGIEYPVFNLGFGLERILMIRNKEQDVRRLLYPQFYKSFVLSDEEIAENIEIEKKPSTEKGKEIAERIAEVAKENSDARSPCGFTAWEGEYEKENLKIKLFEEEENKTLLGPAALNQIYVHNGKIYGLPENVEEFDDTLSEVVDEGINTGISYIQAIANLFASKIEEGQRGQMSVKMAKGPSDVNIRISEIARRYINSQNKEISIKGPVFTAINVESK